MVTIGDSSNRHDSVDNNKQVSTPDNTTVCINYTNVSMVQIQHHCKLFVVAKDVVSWRQASRG